MLPFIFNSLFMRTIIFLSLFVMLANAVIAQPTADTSEAFNKLAAQIKKEVQCCAVPFAPGRELKVTDIDIAANGQVTLYYNTDRKPESFHLYELRKTDDAVFGIQLHDTTSFIQFHISEEKTRLISFTDHAKTKEVYEAFIALFKAGKEQYHPAIALNFTQTLDSINAVLKRRVHYQPQLEVQPNGEAWLKHNAESGFFFDFKELYSGRHTSGFEVRGIELVPTNQRAKGYNCWIYFSEADDEKAFIKMDGGLPESVLQNLHQLLLHLQSLCK